MKRFNDTAFVEHLEAWVSRVDDNEFNRAWENVVGCVKAHARIDRQPKQSARAGTREAWLDWALAFEGEPATYTMIGMLHEFEQMCPETLRDEEFQVVFEQAIALGRGEEPDVLQAKALAAGRPVVGHPHLRVLTGGLG